MAVRPADTKTDYASFESRFAEAILRRERMVGMKVFRIKREAILDALRFLRDTPAARFDMLTELTVSSMLE